MAELVKKESTDDKLNNKTLSSLGQRGGWLINESGMYALIFGSKLEKTREFKRWVTSEVLPTLRKTGHYEVAEDQSVNQLLAEFGDFKVTYVQHGLDIGTTKGDKL